VTEDFVGAKFYCPYALADSNQGIRIKEKTLEFSSTVLSTIFCPTKIPYTKELCKDRWRNYPGRNKNLSGVQDPGYPASFQHWKPEIEQPSIIQ